MPQNAELVKHVDFDPNDVQVVSVRPRKPIELVEPNPQWAVKFAQIAQRIQTALGSQVQLIQHVGSTSVPNLPAKDVIDIDLVVTDPTDEGSYVKDLEAIGFQFLFREPPWFEHRFFGLAEPYVNLHVFGPDCAEVVRHQIFRNWLRENEADRITYAKIKREAAAISREKNEAVTQYNKRKEHCVREILDRAFKAQGLLDP